MQREDHIKNVNQKIIFKYSKRIKLLQITCTQNLFWLKSAILIELEELPKTESHFPWCIYTGFGQNNFPFRAAKVWNVLPDHVTCDRSLPSFKTSI